MTKLLSLVLLGVTITVTAWCQVTVSGTVVDSYDNSPIPGVSIVEKGTSNGTVSSADGQFSIQVTDDKSILMFYFIGFMTREEPLDGRVNLAVKLKVDCIRDWFDVQKFGLHFTSGVINTPIGGQFEIAFPAFIRRGTLTSSIGYQTDFGSNKFFNGDVTMKHFIFSCYFDVDASWMFRRVEFNDDYYSTANSIESDFNFNRFGFTAGYSHLNYKRIETNNRQTYNGPVLGIRTWIGGPLRLQVAAKAAIYSDTQEYFGEIVRNSKHLDVFVKYYRLDTFSEVTLGAGTTFDYRFRRQKG